MSIKVKKPSLKENVTDDTNSPRSFVCRLKFEYFAFSLHPTKQKRDPVINEFWWSQKLTGDGLVSCEWNEITREINWNPLSIKLLVAQKNEPIYRWRLWLQQTQRQELRRNSQGSSLFAYTYIFCFIYVERSRRHRAIRLGSLVSTSSSRLWLYCERKTVFQAL